ncbi:MULTISPECIES: ATP-binding protein [unclassified Nocardioides]|uniref:ATP-binding protein n=1 Tax=unclassified Nocardioides TaxID=2615069 RepID=UPI00361C41F5
MGPDAPRSTSDHATWSDSSARAVLQLMVESVAEMVGFEVAALSVVLGDDLVTLAYTGPEEHRAFIEESDPAAVIEPVLARATSWGPRLRFVEATAIEDLDGHWVRIEQVPTEQPDAWQPDDGLLAVLSNDDGEVIGILSVDRPSSGRRPDERQRSLLERYAAQAERAVLTAFEREALVRQVAHAESARRLIRWASRPTHGSLEDVLRHTHGPLVQGFDARGSWLHVLQPDGPGVGVLRTEDGEPLEMFPDVIDHIESIAPDLWAEQRPIVIATESIPRDIAPGAAEHLQRRNVSSILGVALGVGDECVGFMALTRQADQQPWAHLEIESALQIGHDLGAALMTARALERERELVRELQQVDDHRSQLVATLSHELRTPLTVISGNLELLGGMDLDPEAARYHGAMSRGAHRMGKVVDDLLLLARVSNPHHPLQRVPVDLHTVTRDVVSFVESTARSKGLTLTVDLAPDPLVVPGDAVELDRLVGNLVSNAVKYTPPGGEITVTAARRDDQVVLDVADTGLGISDDDQQGLFRAFFRTSNPEALRESGTGLGLAIVATIVERHDGTIEVGSRLGEGTTFRVTLPAA